MPLFPFWLVNLAPAFLGVPLRTFVWTTFVGIIPGSFVFAQAGTGLGAILDSNQEFSIHAIFNWQVKIALIALGIFALLPILIKKIRRKMLDSRLRPLYQKLCVEPLLSQSWLKDRSPLLMTGLSSLFGVATLPLLIFELNFAAIFFLLLSGYLDTLDGSLARHQGKSTPKGAVLDITSDRLVEFCVILGLFLMSPDKRALPSVLMLGSILLCITTFLVVGIFLHNTSEKSFHYSPGLMERMEAFLFWIAMVIFPDFFSPLAYAFTALVFLTAALRLKEFITGAKTAILQ